MRQTYQTFRLLNVGQILFHYMRSPQELPRQEAGSEGSGAAIPRLEVSGSTWAIWQVTCAKALGGPAEGSH